MAITRKPVEDREIARLKAVIREQKKEINDISDAVAYSLGYFGGVTGRWPFLDSTGDKTPKELAAELVDYYGDGGYEPAWLEQ